MANKILILATFINIAFGRDTELMQTELGNVQTYTVTDSDVKSATYSVPADILVKSSMTPSTYLGLKANHEHGYSLTRYALKGGHFWSSVNLIVDGKIEKYLAINSTLYFTTDLGKLYGYDEETSRLSQLQGTYIPTILKANDSRVFVFESDKPPRDSIRKFCVVELIKNSKSLRSQEILIPEHGSNGLIVKKYGDGLIITSKYWDKLLIMDSNLRVTKSKINFLSPGEVPLAINTVTVDSHHNIMVHLVSIETTPQGYLVAMSQNRTTQLFNSRNVLSVRKQLNGQIKVLAAETPWAQKSYFQAFVDYFRNNEPVILCDSNGQNSLTFRLQTSRIRMPHLLKNGLIFVYAKIRIGLEMSLFDFGGNQLKIPGLYANNIQVFKDGSFVVTAKNNKKLWDWTFYNTLYYYASLSASPKIVINSPTAISIENWRLV